jgi:Beta-L-arabinofuranosidase, GH127
MQRILGTEFGGMGEVLCNLYAVTGRDHYLEVAQRFDKTVFFDPLSAHRDELKGLHVNTHIPQVIARDFLPMEVHLPIGFTWLVDTASIRSRQVVLGVRLKGPRHYPI